MATEIATAYVQIVPSAKGIQGSISSVLNGEATSAGSQAGEKIGSSLGSKLKGAIAALGIGKLIADGITHTSEFETAMAKVSTLFKGTGGEFDGLKSKVLELSSSYGLAATTLADAAYSAESAGVPMKDLGPMIEASAKLAVAGFTDIDTALSATAKTMNAYGLEGSEAMSKVQNVLMQTQNLGITTVGELGAALANVTPTAAAAGVNFEQVGAALAQMTAAGVPTAQATTQLRSAMAELSKSGTKGADALKKAAAGTKYAGQSFQEMIANGANLGDVFSMMQSYADSTGVSMLDLWSSVEAGNAAMLISSDVDTFTENLEQMASGADTVQAAYDKMADTFGTSMNKLKESAKNFVTTLFQGGDISASFDQMLGNLGDVGARLTTWLTNALQGLGQSLPQLMSSLLDFGAGLLESLGKVDWIQLGTTILNGIIGALGTLGQKLISLVSGAIKSVVNGDVDFGAIGQKIWEGITGILGTFGTWAQTLFGDAVTLLTGDGGILSAFGDIGKNILDAVTGALNPGGENFLGSIFSDAESTINGIDWEKLGQNVMKVASGMVNLTGDVLAAAFTAAEETINTIDWENLGQVVGKAANGLVNLADNALTKAFTAVETTINTIDWEALGETVGKAANGLINLGDDALTGAFTAVETTINKIDWAGLGDTVGKAANGLIGLTDEALSGAFTAAHTTISTIKWDKLGETLGGVANALIENSGDVLAAPFKAAHDLLMGIKWDEVGAAIQGGIGDVWTGLTSFLGGLLEGGGAAAEGIGKGIGAAAEGLGEALKKLFAGDDMKQAAEGLTQAMTDLKSALDTGSEELKSAAQNVGACIYSSIADQLTTDKMNTLGSDICSNILAGVTTTESDLDDKLEKVGQTAADKFKTEDTWKGAGEVAIGSIQTGLEGKEEGFNTHVGTFMDSVITTVKEKKWAVAGGDVMAKMQTGVNSKASTLQTTFTSIMGACMTAIKGLSWSGVGEAIIEQITGGVKPAGFTEAMSSAASAGKGAFDGIAWSSVGGNIVSGIVAGINASSGTLYNKMRELAMSALQAAKGALGISSPSKVMKNQVGQWIPKGIAAGIESNRGVITDAMMQISGDLSNADLRSRLTLQTLGNSYTLPDPKEFNADRDVNLVSQLETAMRRVLADADLSLYMDGQKVGDRVNKYLGDKIDVMRYST